MNKFDKSFWEDRYTLKETGWDLGEVSPPIKAWFDKQKDKSARILIPGCGNSHEAEYGHSLGFTNIYTIDIAQQAVDGFIKRVPNFPKENVLLGDFYKLEDQFDFIIEQTFFCALPRSFRGPYAKKVHHLLKPNGKLVGLLFQVPLGEDNPPFGGDKEEYTSLFSEYFNILHMDTSQNSIAPRMGNELWIELEKKE